MQKSRIIVALMAGVLLFPVTSCKKGENDPMSLSSRTSRLKGSWTLDDIESKSTSYNDWADMTTVTTVTYDGTTRTTTTDVTIGSSTTLGTPFTETYSLTYDILKDGSFTMEEVIDGASTTIEGFWYWSCASKTGEIDKKEVVIFTITEVNDGQIETYEGSAIPANGSMQLDRLSGQDMVVIENIDNAYAGGNWYKSDSKYTYLKND
jgi:hypothetical protein